MSDREINVYVIRETPPVQLETRYRAIKLSQQFPELFQIRELFSSILLLYLKAKTFNFYNKIKNGKNCVSLLQF